VARARGGPAIANARATGFYRYKLAAFRDLYSVDFESATLAQIDALPKRVADNDRNRRGLYEVITERANIELMITDPYWSRYEFVPEYPFEAFVFNVNPLLLLDLIEANPQTKFVLFHGGYPWVGETGAIALRHWRHVWIDTLWLPTISPTMARRALHEWLEVMPSDRLLWGADCFNAETIYAAEGIDARLPGTRTVTHTVRPFPCVRPSRPGRSSGYKPSRWKMNCSPRGR
jgi:hypothetical protein